MKKWIFLFASLMAFGGLGAQDLSGPVEYSQGFTAGFHLSSRGGGFEFLFSRGKMPMQLLFGLRGYSVKDAHEAKIESNFREQGSKFVYGKLNHFFILTPTFGLQRELISRESGSFMGLRVTAQAGPALGLLRPYYLDIFVPSPISPLVGTSVSQPYDPEEHTYNDIVGATSFFAAKWDITLQPGISSRLSAQLDFARRPQGITALEVGINADYFFKSVPIMAERVDLSNRQFFLAGTLGLVFGSRW